MNVFFSKQEFRPRAGIRILLFIFFFGLFLALSNSLPLYGFEYIIAGISLLGLFILFFRFVDNRKNIKEAGITISKNWFKEFGIGSAVGFVAMALIFSFELWNNDLEIQNFAWEKVNNIFWFWPIFIYLLKMLSVGFYEELMARSYLIINLKEGFTIGKLSAIHATFIAIIFSSSIFGLGHASNLNSTTFAVLNIILAGVMLAIPYVVSGSLSYSVGLHFAWNFFQGGIFGFPVSGMPFRDSLINIYQIGDDLYTGGMFGPEGGVIGTIVILLISLFFLVYFKLKLGNLALHPIFRGTYLQNQERLTKTGELP